jgi:hypothetical protein
MADNVITINGKEYEAESLDDQQKYFIRQIQSCQAKAEHLAFEHSQVTTAQNAYTKALIELLETEAEEEAEAV